jgi:uncharacterized protein YcbK (DUF882 family)
MHLQRRAIDMRLSGFPTLKVRDLATALQRGAAAFDATSDFVHVHTGRVRLW